jgi:hypothetical protein
MNIEAHQGSHHLCQMWHPWKLFHYGRMQTWINIALVQQAL